MKYKDSAFSAVNATPLETTSEELFSITRINLDIVVDAEKAGTSAVTGADSWGSTAASQELLSSRNPFL